MMTNSSFIRNKTYIIGVIIVLASAALFFTSQSNKKQNATRETDILSNEKWTNTFEKISIGNSFNEPPQVSHLAVNDVDNDGMLDVIVCDIKNNFVSLIKQSTDNTFEEIILSNNVNSPAHVEVIDFDFDGDSDLIVAGLGTLFPNNNRIGSVIILENMGGLIFNKRIIADSLARVADVRAGDIDNDGDFDLVTAQFGYDDGATSWIENLGNWKFKNHNLQNISGPINVELVDIDNDNDLDIVSLVSQEWEEIYCFINDGRGKFKSKLLWGSSNDDFGSSGISICDLNNDGNPDVLYTNGDAFDYIPPSPRPWHGVQWLENQGDLTFKYHRICNLPGAFSARAFDMDMDNDLDVFAVSGFNNWESQQAESIVWIENKGNTFEKHTISNSPTHLITLGVGDFNNDGYFDLVTAGVYVYSPFDKMDRVTLWINNKKQSIK